MSRDPKGPPVPALRSIVVAAASATVARRTSRPAARAIPDPLGGPATAVRDSSASAPTARESPNNGRSIAMDRPSLHRITGERPA